MTAGTAEFSAVRFPPDNAKFPFYARHGVRELLVAHPLERWVRCWALRGDAYEQVDRSELLDVAMATVVDEVRWP